MGKFNSNIAILRLEHSIKVHELKPLQMDLTEISQESHNTTTLLGWTRYHAYEKNVTVTNISECTQSAHKNYSNADYLCIKNVGPPVAGTLGNPCLSGCPLMINDTLVGLITAGHKRLTKNNLLLAITKGKFLPFIHATINGIDFVDWQKDIEGMVEEFVKHVVDKAFF